jgi:predicted DNA binding CopG/RHH family protein
MKKKTKNDSFPKNFRVIKDFLPPPEELLPQSEMEKILLSIDKPVIDFFKKRAEKSDQKYQRLIREVLKRYYLMHNSDRKVV